MYKHILIATDGSDASARAVSQGVALARQLGAKVTFATVSEMWSPAEMADKAKLGEGFGVEDFEAAAAAAAKAILASASDAAAKAGVASDTIHVADKRPAEGVCAAAASKGCDAIVVGTHGRRGLSRLLVGSQASEIVATASVPVIVAR